MSKYQVVISNLSDERYPIMEILEWSAARFTGRDWREKVLMSLDLMRMDNQQDDLNVCVLRDGDPIAVLNSVVCERPQTDWSDWGLIEYRHVTSPRTFNSIMYRQVTLAE